MKTVLHYLRPRLGIMSVGLLIKFFGTVAELLFPSIIFSFMISKLTVINKAFVQKHNMIDK